MTPYVITAFILLLALILIRRHLDHEADRLRMMTMEELEQEAHWAAQGGNYPNAYSRELDRRQAI